MAVSFDYTNLWVVLDASTTAYDLLDDIYEPAKDDWLSTGMIENRRHPFPFRSVSGDPVGGGQNAPPFIFLRNDKGWRIKKPEADIETRITGNLVREDTTLPLSIPPNGAFAPTLEIFLSNVANIDLAAFSATVWQYVVEGTFTAEEALRLVLAATAGQGGRVTDTLYEYFDPTGATKRLSVVTDGQGDRTAVTATP